MILMPTETTAEHGLDGGDRRRRSREAFASRMSDVAYATLHRFMAGERAVSMEALDQLCTYLGLGLCRMKRPEDVSEQAMGHR